MREQGVVLEHEADIALVSRQPRQVAPAERDRSGSRREEAGDQAQGGGLAAAAGAEKRDELAGLDREREVFENLGRPVMGGDGVDVEWLCHGKLLRKKGEAEGSLDDGHHGHGQEHQQHGDGSDGRIEELLHMGEDLDRQGADARTR